MKIIHHNSHQLILERKIGFDAFSLIWGLVFSGIPLFMFSIFFAGLQVININCERVETTHVNCQVKRSNFAGLKMASLQQFNNFTAVKFEQIQGVDGDGHDTLENKIILENKYAEKLFIEDFMFINGVKGDEEKMRLLQSQMQNFLNSQDIYLTVNYDNRWRLSYLFLFLFLSIFFVIGGRAIISAIISMGDEKFIFDKSTSQFYFEKKNLLSKKIENYSLEQVDSIIVKVDEDSEGYKTYYLIIPFSYKQQYQLDRSIQIDTIQAKADEIANFLGIKVITKTQ